MAKFELYYKCELSEQLKWEIEQKEWCNCIFLRDGENILDITFISKRRFVQECDDAISFRGHYIVGMHTVVITDFSIEKILKVLKMLAIEGW